MTRTCIGGARTHARMAPPNNLPLLLLLLVVFGLLSPAVTTTSTANAFNVTEILDRYPEFKLFNLLLSKTRVANEVNARNDSVTLLVADNAAVDWLLRSSGRLPRAKVKELVSVHVVLDYLDAAKLAALPRGTHAVQVTTLFQASGTARGRGAGFLNVTATPRGGGAVVFVSAAPGSLVTARFKRAVTAKPYNVSVLQITNLIVPRGFLTAGPRSPPTIGQMAPTAPSPAPPPPHVSANAPSVEDDETMKKAPAPAPSHGHVAQATTWWSAAAGGAAAAVLSFL